MEIDSDSTDLYRKMYLEYAPMLLRFAEKFVSLIYAEDIIHDVFLKFWDRKIFLLPENELKRLLYVAVKNACIDQLRRFSLEQEYIDKRVIQLKLDELDFFEESENLFMQNDLMAVLLQKIDELPEKSREIFKMFYLEGLKAAEIAGRLNLSVRTVQNQLYRALIYLRKKGSGLLTYLFTIF